MSGYRWRCWYSSCYDMPRPAQSCHHVISPYCLACSIRTCFDNAACVFTCFPWKLGWRSSESPFQPDFEHPWMPLWPLVRPTAILRVFCWLCHRFHLRRPIALGPGLQYKNVSAPLFAAHWEPEANLCGAFAFGCLPWFVFHS